MHSGTCIRQDLLLRFIFLNWSKVLLKKSNIRRVLDMGVTVLCYDLYKCGDHQEMKQYLDN